MPWSDSCFTGFDAIDRDHRNLVEIYDRLVLALGEQLDANSIDIILTEFVNSVADHYVYENRLMTKIKFADIEPHIADHDRAMTAMSKIISEFHAGRYQAANELVGLINMWELAHIQNHGGTGHLLRPPLNFLEGRQGLYLTSRSGLSNCGSVQCG